MIKAGAWQTPLAVILAGAWAAALAVGHNHSDVGFIDQIEATLTDLRAVIRGVKTPPDLVTIVAIDDQVAREQGKYPLPRAVLAGIIDEIARYKPKVVALDVLLVDAGPPAEDAELARALGNVKAVIAAAAVFNESKQTVASKGGGPFDELPVAAGFLLPQKIFADQAAVGVVNLTTDGSGDPRAMPLLMRSADRMMMSLPLQVAGAASRDSPQIGADDFKLAGRGMPTDIGHLLPMSFYGPRGTIRTISASRVLAGQISAADIENRVVIIGATVAGGGDVFSTPFDPVMPGVEVVATAITHLLSRDTPIRNNTVRLFDAGFAIGLAMLCVALLAWRRNAVGLIAIVMVMAAWAVLNTVAYAHGIWMSAALPLAAAVPPAMAFGALQIWLGRRNVERFAARSDLMRQFQVPGLRDWLIQHPDFLLQPQHQDAAVIFIDLSRFTALSETISGDVIRDLLKSFHALVDQAAVSHGGMITAFMGDGAMILFGLPSAATDDAARAVRCCIDLGTRTEEWLSQLPPSIAARTGFKIGAHFGDIVASRLGGASHQHITATGDTVNIASRLMEVAKDHGAQVAMSDCLLQAAGTRCRALIQGTLTGPMDAAIRGRSGVISAWLWHNGHSAPAVTHP